MHQTIWKSLKSLLENNMLCYENIKMTLAENHLS